MGKRVKPKGKNPRKQPRSRVSDVDPNQDESELKPDTTNEEETTKTREGCNHYTKGDAHLNKILLEILSSNNEYSSCDHCRDDVPQSNRKGGASGGKKKKQGGGAGPKGGGAKPNPNPIWVCLDCGRSFCGGEVDKEVPYGHARRHAKQERHNWAVGPSSSGTAWCYLCDAEVPIEMPSIEEAVMSTSKLTAEPDYTKAIKSDGKQESVSIHAGPYHHSIRGLSNLGNTCFFNSVLQNLLALKILRESLLNPRNSDPDDSNVPFVKGPLTMSLRKLFLETSGGEDCKGVLSPKNLFGNICAKAPQFRGYQQQDSHELLRYLLDGLNTEETSVRKLKQADSEKGDGSDRAGPTLVDSMFSGRLSSAISCRDCGYTSIVHEPFLDLSLPVPAKKTGTAAKRGGNMPSVVRGRGRSLRSKERPAVRSSLADEEKKRTHGDGTENTSSKTPGVTECTASKLEELSNPMNISTEAGADSEEVAISKMEPDESGSGAGPDSTTTDVADSSWMDFLVDQEGTTTYVADSSWMDFLVDQEGTTTYVADSSWMDFLVDQESASMAQELSVTESVGPEFLGSDSMVPEPGPGNTIIAAGEAGPEVAVDLEGKMRLQNSLQESEAVKQEVVVSESAIVGQDAEDQQNISSKGDVSCSAMAIGMKSPSHSIQSTVSINGFNEKVHDNFVACDSFPCVFSDKLDGPLRADKSDGLILKVKVGEDADLLQDQCDEPRSLVYDANTLSSFVKSSEQEVKGNTQKVAGDNGWLPGKHERMDGMDLKANVDADTWLNEQDDKLTDMVLKADVHEDMDWSMNDGSDISSTVVEKKVHVYSQDESYELESTAIRVDGDVPTSVAFKASSSSCMGIVDSGSKPASPNQRLTSTNSDLCGDSIIDSSGFPNSTPIKDESDECCNTQERPKTEIDTNTDTEISLHPPEDTNLIPMALSTLNAGTEMQQEEEFDGFGDMFNEPEETVGPVNRPSPKPDDEDDADSIFWSSGSAFSGFGFNGEEVDDTDKPVSVASCLELFTKPELLTGEHAWHCEKCSELQGKETDNDCGNGDRKEKVMRDAMKRYMVDRAPQVLTVHLKRFSQDSRGRLSKLRGRVNFEEILDLTPFIHPRSKDKNKCMYQLVGLVEHSGSMSGGHYVAYIQGEKTLKSGVHCQTWYYASDAHVKEVSLSEVLRSEAYLLFYERVKDENSS